MNDLQMYKVESRNPNLKTNVKNIMYKLFKFMRILTFFSNAMNKFCNPSLELALQKLG